MYQLGWKSDFLHFCALFNSLICVNMNEQVQEFLEEQKKKAKQERDNHLCKLGLYDLEKCTKSFCFSLEK